jgi:signal transduction histidine kinase
MRIRRGSSDERFRNLFDAVPIPAYAWRRDGDDFVLESYNPAADAASKHDAPNHIGRRAREVYSDEPDILADFERASRSDETFSREFWYTVPGTDDRYALEVTYAPVAEDTLVVHTVSRTEQIVAERELTSRLEELRAADADRRQLLGDLARAQERERERIAEEIREDAIEPLVAVALRLQTVQRTGGGDVAESVSKLERSVGDAITQLRHLTFTLHPEMLSRTTLAVALRDLLDHMIRRAAVRTNLENRLTHEPDTVTRIRAYRIAQQAIANAVRHGQPELVTVVLDEREGDLVLVVTDDGVGFDATSAPAVPDAGLSLMRRRAELAGGRVEVWSEPGQGTSVEVTLPATW